MVTSVPISLGTILGFSVNVGGNPSTVKTAAAGPSAFDTSPFSAPALYASVKVWGLN